MFLYAHSLYTNKFIYVLKVNLCPSLCYQYIHSEYKWIWTKLKYVYVCFKIDSTITYHNIRKCMQIVNFVYCTYFLPIYAYTYKVKVFTAAEQPSTATSIYKTIHHVACICNHRVVWLKIHLYCECKYMQNVFCPNSTTVRSCS